MKVVELMESMESFVWGPIDLYPWNLVGCYTNFQERESWEVPRWDMHRNPVQ